MKYGIIIALLSVFALGACKPKEAPVVQAPIESPVRQEEPLGQIAAPKPIMVEKSLPKAKAKEKGTPRLDALDRRVRAIEDKIVKYEQKYGQ